MKDLHTQYMSLLSELIHDGDQKNYENQEIYTSQHLQNKFFVYFKDKIKKDQGNTRNGNIISNSSMSLDLAVREAFIEKKSIKTSVREVVLLLRRGILYKSFNKVLPPDITVKDLTEGEAFVPELLEDFYKYLLCGANQRLGNTARNERRVSSFSQDAIYAMSNGKVKPSKHLTLGMAMKSITSS